MIKPKPDRACFLDMKNVQDTKVNLLYNFYDFTNIINIKTYKSSLKIQLYLTIYFTWIYNDLIYIYKETIISNYFLLATNMFRT